MCGNLFIFNSDVRCVSRKFTTYSCLQLSQNWLLMRFILSVVVERAVRFVATVDVVLEEYNSCLPINKWSDIKVARVVIIKMFFMGWFYYHMIILIKLCEIPYKSLDEALLFSRNQVFWLKNWKLWRAPTTIEFNIFCWNSAHVSYWPVSTN